MILDKPVNLSQLTKEAKAMGMSGPGHGATTIDNRLYIYCYSDNAGRLCSAEADKMYTNGVLNDLCDLCKQAYTAHHANQSTTRDEYRNEHSSAPPSRAKQLELIMMGFTPPEQHPVTDQTPRLVS